MFESRHSDHTLTPLPATLDAIYACAAGVTATERLERARRALESADLLLAAADFEGAVNRAYYAMFYAAHAALAQQGVET